MSGYRGYIASRPIMDERAPQHVQNLVVRDYARRRRLPFLLSATEWAMAGCHRVLEQILDELPELDGIIAYSLFMLPEDKMARAMVWDRILGGGRGFHAALEGLSVTSATDVARVEDLWLARSILPLCPPSFPSR